MVKAVSGARAGVPDPRGNRDQKGSQFPLNPGDPELSALNPNGLSALSSGAYAERMATAATVPDGKDADDDAGLQRSKPLSPALYLVATPIGNSRDITLRALDILKRADILACEDTRVTGKLLSMHGIGRPLTRYDDHVGPRVRPKLLAALAAGQSVALVSDAGTPLVSDPGYRLAKEAAEAGHVVTTAPGASAALVALQLSGLPADRFLFAGFLDSRTTARRKGLEELKAVPATLIFFEGPSRVADSLADMAAVLGDRPAAVTRELTKLHEEVRRGPLSELAAYYAEAGAPRGEVVIVVGGPLAEEPASEEQLDDLLRAALKTQSVRDAAASVTASTGLPKKQVYARALALSADD